VTIKTILHPTDFSANADYAFLTACALAEDYKARLILLHVTAPIVSVLPEPVPNPLKSAEAQDSLRWRFSWPQAPDPAIEVEHRVAEGDPPEEILRLAQALHCDLIVMGTQGRTGLERLLIGSVAEEVLRKAACPVLTLKMPEGFSPSVRTASSNPVEVVDVRPLRSTPTASIQTNQLLQADGVEVFQVIFPAGDILSEDTGPATVILHCVEGLIAVSAFGRTQRVKAGQLLHLHGDVPYSIKGIEDASVLVTRMLPKP
jgi:nucleotide-binding universal stress UspA family protein/quercetin dioxygenase-like cupin family protein